jgi:pyruvate formate lyase activating enzyme
MTADSENIRGIASYISGIYPEVSYELLNYNPLASAKYPMTGREFRMPEDTAVFTEETMQGFYEAALLGGVRNLIRETKI